MPAKYLKNQETKFSTICNVLISMNSEEKYQEIFSTFAIYKYWSHMKVTIYRRQTSGTSMQIKMCYGRELTRNPAGR